MAGGTDLLVKLRHGQARPRAVIGLKGIPGLDQIRFKRTEGIFIGPTALLSDVASHPDIRRVFPAVAYAARSTANTQIRNMGTLVGNLCNAAPSADNAPTLIAMHARVTLTSHEGSRQLPLEQFFRGPGVTTLKPGEIMTEVFVPRPPRGAGTSYQWISARGRVDISAVGVGVLAVLRGKTCKEARIALGAVAPTPMRAKKAEGLLLGKALSHEAVEEAAAQAARESKPITDVRASAAYRRAMVAVLTRRALREAKKRATRR